MKTKAGFFFIKSDKFSKSLARLRGGRKVERFKLAAGGMRVVSSGMTRIIEYFEKLYAYKLDNLGGMGKFFQGHKLPKLTQEE